MYKILIKIILLVCPLIFFSNSSFAISLSELQTVSQTEEISNYNYNYSYEMLIKNNKFSSIKTFDAFKSEIIKLKYQNSGIEGGHRIKKVYNLDGMLIEDLSSIYNGYESKQIQFFTIGYDLAAEAFYKAYQLRF